MFNTEEASIQILTVGHYLTFTVKGERFCPRKKILLNFTFGIFKVFIYKNKQTQLGAKVLHIICVMVKFSINLKPLC